MSPAGWPSEVEDVCVPRSPGSADQPALFYQAPGREPAPLLVGLHTWGGEYSQAFGVPYLRWCLREGWHFLHPDFGGPNLTAGAMGSERAVADVVQAVEWVRHRCAVDPARIYLVGASGGGHMALLMAGRHPELWGGVSAWCPISDLARWHRECRENPTFARYADDIESALGGSPASDPARAEEALKRSPVRWLSRAASVALDIHAGVHDGRSGSVPFTHSLSAFNAVAEEKIDERELARFYATQTPPRPDPADASGLYGAKTPLYRATSRNARVTIFDGGHDIVHAVALNWLAQQRSGAPALWEIPDPKPLPTTEAESRSGL